MCVKKIKRKSTFFKFFKLSFSESRLKFHFSNVDNISEHFEPVLYDLQALKIFYKNVFFFSITVFSSFSKLLNLYIVNNKGFTWSQNFQKHILHFFLYYWVRAYCRCNHRFLYSIYPPVNSVTYDTDNFSSSIYSKRNKLLCRIRCSANLRFLIVYTRM